MVIKIGLGKFWEIKMFFNIDLINNYICKKERG